VPNLIDRSRAQLPQPLTHGRQLPILAVGRWSNDQNARVVAAGLDYKVVELFEIVMISR
jgi:hypothetical protein